MGQSSCDTHRPRILQPHPPWDRLPGRQVLTWASRPTSDPSSPQRGVLHPHLPMASHLYHHLHPHLRFPSPSPSLPRPSAPISTTSTSLHTRTITLHPCDHLHHLHLHLLHHLHLSPRPTSARPAPALPHVVMPLDVNLVENPLRGLQEVLLHLHGNIPGQKAHKQPLLDRRDRPV